MRSIQVTFRMPLDEVIAEVEEVRVEFTASGSGGSAASAR